MTPTLPYEDFLRAKIRIDAGDGVAIAAQDINPALRGFNQDLVRWNCALGRSADFCSFGLHKTVTNLETMRQVGLSAPCYRLCVLPLGVRQEFFRDARRFFTDDYRLDLKFIKSDSEIKDPKTIYLTNYESVRDNKIDLQGIGAISLDEADCLRSFGSKTFGEFLFGPAQQIPLRWVYTATPAPNEYLELISYAHFLGVMDMGAAKTRFFKRDPAKADNLTLHPHKEEEFWLWVGSWATFLYAPSDLGYSDEGYILPDLDIRWQMVPSDHTDAGQDAKGQRRMFKDTTLGVSQAAREKRASMPARLAKLMEIRAEDPAAHRVIWHSLEDERKAIEKLIPSCGTIYGSQDPDEQESRLEAFRDGNLHELGAKPVMLGGGGNLQYHCSWAMFLGIDCKFRDFIQAVHRLQRFGQTKTVRVDIIYSEAEAKVREDLERKWSQHKALVANMREIVRKFGLSSQAKAQHVARALGVERLVESGKDWELARNDSVYETRLMPSNSVGLVWGSWPFSNQYEYSLNYACFGHTDDLDHFIAQLDYLTPELFRVLQPGRVCAIYVKDRDVPGEMIGQSYQTVSPFHAHIILHMIRHGFTYGGMITVVTDVVKENNQTYRLGWSEKCKDGSRMTVGIPEYVLLFRKPPTDPTSGYADDPVRHDKSFYTIAKWQIDACALWRSSGNRLLDPAEFETLRAKEIYRRFRDLNLTDYYDYEEHVEIGDFLNQVGTLRKDFSLIPPQSWHPDVWSDIVRVNTLNAIQTIKKKEKHICPLQIDITDRIIETYTNPGDLVYDPFAGLGTVPIRALKLGRKGKGSELNTQYWKDSLTHAKAMEEKLNLPTLFDTLDLVDVDLPKELVGTA